jgi:hypothetical protein
MNTYTRKTKSWIITKQTKGSSIPKEAYIPIDGRLFCSMDRNEMESEAKRLNGLEDEWMYFIEPQS